jgi:hypothetical protein
VCGVMKLEIPEGGVARIMAGQAVQKWKAMFFARGMGFVWYQRRVDILLRKNDVLEIAMQLSGRVARPISIV